MSFEVALSAAIYVGSNSMLDNLFNKVVERSIEFFSSDKSLVRTEMHIRASCKRREYESALLRHFILSNKNSDSVQKIALYFISRPHCILF